MSNAFGTLHTHHGLKKARFQGKIKTFNWSTSETGDWSKLEVNKNKMVVPCNAFGTLDPQHKHHGLKKRLASSEK